MINASPEFTFDIAVRAHTQLPGAGRSPAPPPSDGETPDAPAPPDLAAGAGWEEDWPHVVLVVDTETTTDLSQRLRFGAFRTYQRSPWSWEHTLTCEGLFYADDMPEDDLKMLVTYGQARREGDLDGQPGGALTLLSHEAFLKNVFIPLLKRNGLIVGFNLPYDLSRIAQGYGVARGKTDGKLVAGGFSFWFKQYQDKSGGAQPDKFTPRVCVRNLNSKAAFIQARRPWKQNPKYAHRTPRFLDLRTLAYALTGRGHTLDSAAREFGCAHHKAKAEEHGAALTPQYLDYARTDTLVTFELYEKLLEEYRAHPIPTPPDKAYSTASIGKGYLRAMGVRTPRLEATAMPWAPDRVHGFAMSAYYGGRSECHVRKLPVPVIYCDFTSMYPTVCTLMGLWRFVTAESIQVEEATGDVQAFLDTVTADDLFRPETWPLLPCLVQLAPDGRNRLPVRAEYAPGKYNIGLNALATETPLWFTLADLAASKLLTGHAPRILRALRFTPGPRQQGLRPVRIRKHVRVDPYRDDLFKRLIEERKRLKRDASLSPVERARHDLALKVVANATSYGIWAELNRDDDDPDAEEADVQAFAHLGRPFLSRVKHPERPGAYYCPPIAAFITGGARLMLALAQAEVEGAGGTYAFMDTDSIAIVAEGGGGRLEYSDHHKHRRSLPILSCAQVDGIVAKFEALNPYDRRVIPGSLLKVEATHGALPPPSPIHPRTYMLREGETAPRTDYLAWDRARGHAVFLPEEDAQREGLGNAKLLILAIAAKRYALVLETAHYAILVKNTELVLGNFLSPKPEEHWVQHFWLSAFAQERYGTPLSWPRHWESTPALVRFTLNTPAMMTWVVPFNQGKPYRTGMKPFNFMVHAFVNTLASPQGAESVHLIAPYTSPRRATSIRWLNLKTGKFTTIGLWDDTGMVGGDVAVKSYVDLATDYLWSAEPKYIGEGDSQPGDSLAIGQLLPITVRARGVKVIGKETSIREEVQAHALPWNERQNLYQRDDWDKLKPLLSAIPTRTLIQDLGITNAHVQKWRNGTRPNPETLDALIPYLLGRLRERFPDVAVLTDEELLDWEGLDAIVERFCQTETAGGA